MAHVVSGVGVWGCGDLGGNSAAGVASTQYDCKHHFQVSSDICGWQTNSGDGTRPRLGGKFYRLGHRPKKKVVFLKIEKIVYIKFWAHFLFFLRKNFLMWVGGWVRRRNPGCHPPPLPRVTLSRGLDGTCGTEIFWGDGLYRKAISKARHNIRRQCNALSQRDGSSQAHEDSRHTGNVGGGGEGGGFCAAAAYVLHRRRQPYGSRVVLSTTDDVVSVAQEPGILLLFYEGGTGAYLGWRAQISSPRSGGGGGTGRSGRQNTAT